MSRGPIPDRPPTRPTVPQLVPLIRAYYAKPGNLVGGNLHAVLDDGNLADGHIEWCLARARDEGDADGVLLAELLLQMTPTQRRKLAAMSHYPF
jgi:hypothetical protein